jgi:hypothetical protein
MGNNSSTAAGIDSRDSNIRKSTASDKIRKLLSLASSTKQLLDEEFSDLILHPVKRPDIVPQTSPSNNQFKSKLKPVSLPPQLEATNATSNKINLFGSDFQNFSQEMIEDECNELNDGLIETDVQDISRNLNHNDISQDDDYDVTSEISIGDNMDIDAKDELSDEIPPVDINDVDFTKLNNQNQSPSTVNKTQLTSKSLIPIEIKWMNNSKEVINKISVIGSFSNWKDIIPLTPSKSNPYEYSTTINLSLGLHKLLYMINNEYRVSELLPTATDQEGIFFNWFEVIDESHLFNHPANQPDSSRYDANIRMDNPDHPFQHHNLPAGKRQLNEINEKSTNLLTKISKESSNFEHIEYVEDTSQENETANNNNLDYNQSGNLNKQFLAATSVDADNASATTNTPTNTTTNNVSSNNDINSTGKIYNSGFNLSNNSFQQTPEKLQYSSEIPEMFVNYDYFKNKSPDYELPEPPQLPAHLNNVLLNKISNSNSSRYSSSQVQSLVYPSGNNPSRSGDPYQQPDNPSMRRPALRRADSSYYASNKQSYHLAIPNHVILNHLMTTSIRNDVLTVACITRYSGKFITQIVHSPANASTSKPEAEEA